MSGMEMIGNPWGPGVSIPANMFGQEGQVSDFEGIAAQWAVRASAHSVLIILLLLGCSWCGAESLRGRCGHGWHMNNSPEDMGFKD